MKKPRTRLIWPEKWVVKWLVRWPVRWPVAKSFFGVFLILCNCSFAAAAGKTPPASDDSTTDATPKSPAQSAEARETAKEDEGIKDVLNSLDYPELQVVPRASQRLRMEAKAENSSWYLTHASIEISGLATLATAIAANNMYRPGLSPGDTTNAGSVITVSEFIGAGWLVSGILIGLQKPYGSGLEQINKIKGKDERAILFRERLSEESLEKPAKLMRPLKYASVLTNFAASVVMGIYLSDQGRIIAGISAALALLPLMYEDRSIDVYDKHMDYKRKIYRPMSRLDFMLDPQKKYVPMAKLTWEF